MNEQILAQEIRRHLDRGTDQLSYRVQQRLEAARHKALARVPAAGPVAQAGRDPSGVPPVAALGVPGARRSAPLWLRLTGLALPTLLVLVGVVVGDSLQQEQAVQELAEVDSALLTDDVPLVAYADHGFGVYLKNTRR